MREVLDTWDTHSYHGIREERVGRGNDHVTHPRQHQAARDARALHHRDRGLGDLPPPAAHSQVYLHFPGIPLVAARSADVVPPHDGLAFERHVDIALGRAYVVP